MKIKIKKMLPDPHLSLKISLYNKANWLYNMGEV